MTQSTGKKPEFRGNRAAWRVAVAAATVAGLFVLAVSVLLIVNYLQVQRAQPLDSPQLLELRERLAATGEPNEELVQQVRALDLLARRAFFTSQTHVRVGAQLLLVGAVVFVVALQLAARWNPEPPEPGPRSETADYWRALAQSKELITGGAVILVLMALTAAYLTPFELPAGEVTAQGGEDSAADDGEATASRDFPSWEEMQQQWPSFRGPGGFGVAYFTTAPAQWDGESGQGIAWKTEVPLPGFNSPVVWDGHLFVSGATEEVREVFCYDTATGGLRWRKALPAFPGTPDPPPDVMEDTGYAAPTMAVHGTRAYAIFATGDLACFDFDGQLLWGRNIGVPENHYGHSSSLLAFEDKLYIQFDDSNAPRLIAVDAATGDEVWVTGRTHISWASPACPPTPFGFQLLLASELHVNGYDPATGELLWSAEALDGEVAPSPTISGDMVFVANEYAMASAVRLTQPQEGAIESEVAWQWDYSLPDVSSPTSSEKHFYVATSLGEIVCLDIETGEEVWNQEYDEGFYASPIRVGERIYAPGRQGTTHVFSTASQYEELAVSKLSEGIYATPAFLDGRIYVRTLNHLVCIESDDGN